MSVKAFSPSSGVWCLIIGCIPLFLFLGWDAYYFDHHVGLGAGCLKDGLAGTGLPHLIQTLFNVLTDYPVFLFNYILWSILHIHEWRIDGFQDILEVFLIAVAPIMLFGGLVFASFKTRRHFLGKILAAMVMLYWIFMSMIPPQPMC